MSAMRAITIRTIHARLALCSRGVDAAKEAPTPKRIRRMFLARNNRASAIAEAFVGTSKLARHTREAAKNAELAPSGARAGISTLNRECESTFPALGAHD